MKTDDDSKSDYVNSLMEVDYNSQSEFFNLPMDEHNTPAEQMKLKTQKDRPNARTTTKVKSGNRIAVVPALPMYSNANPPPKSHTALRALQPHHKIEELLLSDKGAPKTMETINNIVTPIILDGGAFSSLISTKFLEHLSNVINAPSDTIFLMADDYVKPSLGVAKPYHEPWQC
ncbi:hypothetical protein DSO57_1007189 [Entomophthora muscae]|uniref:Uncharacterized protein n=1 Tax=Entomophthora muscae TaxID=34485 RepID=A0ACC2SWN8_9FUNG|nr:hypothetical protein DSO57_1007189 [Entomophthora muscae]